MQSPLIAEVIEFFLLLNKNWLDYSAVDTARSMFSTILKNDKQQHKIWQTTTQNLANSSLSQEYYKGFSKIDLVFRSDLIIGQAFLDILQHIM